MKPIDPVCDENQTLDRTVTPPVCKDNCDQNDTEFPTLSQYQDVPFTWNENEDRSLECNDVNGIVQGAVQDCKSVYRCVVLNCDVNQTLDTSVEPPICVDKCNEKNTPFPQKAINEEILDSWTQNHEANSAMCVQNQGKVQTQKSNCESAYRCVKETETPSPVCDVPVGSYVSPSDSTFHEDITITGTEVGLHYSSGNVDENQSKTLAYGWSLSNHATLVENRLYLGSGNLLVVEPTQEGNLTVIKTGSSELLFDLNGKHIQTRDLYTREIETTFTYDTEDNIIGITNMYDEITTITRDSNGIITSITAPHGQSTYISIDENGDLIEVQYEDTTSYTFEYENHLMTLEREPNGNEFLHFFDEQGKVVKVIDAVQGEWNFGSTNDTTSGTHTVERASGDIVTYKNHFLENGMLKTEKTLPTGDIILYENAVDDSVSSTTTCGQTNTNTYKLENGILAKDPLHDRRILESSTQTTPSGLSKVTNYTTNYIFDANNTLISVENISTTNGATTTSLRDYNLSTSTLTSAEGRMTQATYDKTTQLPLEVRYANLKPTRYTYDDKGRVVKTKQGKRIMRYSYDSRGNLQEVHNVQRDTKTTYAYDLRDRVIETTYPDGTTEQFTYDANGNLVTRTVPTPADHTFAYNGVNKRTGYTSPLQSQTTYTYDKQRRVTKVTKPSQKSIDTTYTDGRITAVTTPEGTTTYNYACQNSVSSISKEDESLNFTYDGTLTTSMVQSGILNQTLGFTYNNDFQVDSFTYANQTEDYSYDKDGLLTQSGDYSITRNAENGLTTNITDGTLTTKFTYNKFGDLRDRKDQVFKLKLRRKEARIAKKTETIVTKVPRKKKRKGFRKKKTTTIYHYSYDERDRLVEVSKGKRKNKEIVEQYTYDANGNRASATVSNITTTASYTLDDQLVVYGDNTYRYDEDGYLAEKTTPEGTTTYDYGTLGELREVVTPSKTISYEHNANTQRVAKKVNGEIVEKYLWLNLTTLLATYDKDDNLVQRFEYADSRMPISMTQDSKKYYLHYDQVGSLRAVSDINKNIIKEITYDTYGNILSDSNEAFKVPFGFAGGLYDADTKLTRFGYRDYDAYTGKWTAKDPIGFDGGDSNLYGYVLGDPVNFVDPDGLINRNGGHGHNRSGSYLKGPFGPLCGPEGKPLAKWIPDVTPFACIQHDNCYAKCAKRCGGEECKEMCDYQLIDYNPIYGAATYWAGGSTYFPIEKECGCE